MVKKWRSCLSLLVSFAFILSMLFLDTLHVNATDAWTASTTLNFGGTFNFGSEYSNETSGSISGISGGGGLINNGSGSIYSVSGGGGSIRSYTTQYRDGGTYHCKIGFELSDNWHGTWRANELLAITATYGGFTASSGTVSNVQIYLPDGTLLLVKSGNAKTYYAPVSEVALLANGYNWGLRAIYLIEFDITFDNSIGSSSFTTTFTLADFTNSIRPASSDEIASNTTEVHDSSANQSLSNIETSEAAISESVTNPSGGGILGTIKNFFNGFFGWLHDTILGLFVPSSDYFTTWFTNVNTLLSNKLGMLYAPLDLLISTLNAVYSASSEFTGVPFPEIRWGDTVLVSAQNLTFSNLLGEHFEDIQGYVYFGTDVVLLFAFLMLLQRKITLVLRGHESG